jgi:hypothetical protein
MNYDYSNSIDFAKSQMTGGRGCSIVVLVTGPALLENYLEDDGEL